MASIENRSRFLVTVKNKPELERSFSYNRVNELKAYLAELKEKGLKPKLARSNDAFAIRSRDAGHQNQCLFAHDEQEAIDFKNKLETEHRCGLFTDYSQARQSTFADLLMRYLNEESPKHKSFLTEGYLINAVLVAAQLPPVNLAQVINQHPCPHPRLSKTKIPDGKGTRLQVGSESACFIRKAFADLRPTDFNTYINERCKHVMPASVDREVDIFSAVCNTAIDTWWIAVAKNPMNGVKRPQFFNEGDRRLRPGEEQKLLNAAYDEDAQQSLERRLEELVEKERPASAEKNTVYRHKKIIKAARAKHLTQAEETYQHAPIMETFIQFQLMTGARRCETLGLTWKEFDFTNQTVAIPESKNGRPRTLLLRKDIIALLMKLPRTSEKVFALTLATLINSWERIRDGAGLTGEDVLKVHDLRHEAISRTAEAGRNLKGGFSIADLQVFSGHRDIRMLLRYTHLCVPSLAKRLDEAFKDQSQVVVHRGKRRLKRGADLTIRELANVRECSSQATVSGNPQSFATPSSNNVLMFQPRKRA